jgi:hypothetical protein
MRESKIDIILNESEKAFLAETTRAEKLTDKAEKYLTAIALIIGFNLIDFDRITIDGATNEILSGVFAISGFVMLGAALVLALLTLRVLQYGSYPRGETLIDDLKDKEITDDMAKIKLAKMYLGARDKNAQTNDRRARLLSWSGTLLVVGFVLAVISQFAGKMVLV